MIYLDNSSTTLPDLSMINAVMEEARIYYGNPSSPHFLGQISKDFLGQSREQVASLLGAQPHQIIFTSGGTEANALALHDKTVWASEIEHKSVLKFATTTLKVTAQGFLNIDALEQLLINTSKPICISVMLANNETGIKLDPFNKLLILKQKYNFLLHIDATQAVGKVPIDVDILGADLLTLSGHKFHAFKGIGALYFRNHDLVKPLNNINAEYNSAHEFGLRPGTENYLGIASLGHMAQKLLVDKFYLNRIAQIGVLRNELEQKLSDIVEINGDLQHRLPHISSLSIIGINDIELFIEALSEAGVCVSGQSACSSGLSLPSYTLAAMFGADSPRLKNTLRVSLSVNTTAKEIDEACKIIRAVRAQQIGD